MTASTPVAAAASGAWLFSRRTDLWLFGGSTLLASLLLGAGALTGDVAGDAPIWVWILTVVAIDVAHVWATFWRVYADPVELRRRAPLYIGVPVAAYACGTVAYSVSPLLFWRVLAYLAVFHFARQQYGWMALYRRKNGEPAEPGDALARRVDVGVITLATVAPLVFWHANPRRFHWLIAGDFAIGLPRWTGSAALALLVLFGVLYAAKELGRARAGRPVSAGKSLIVATTALMWVLGIVVLDSDYAFTVTNVIIHGVPYFGLVYLTAKERAKELGGVAHGALGFAARGVAFFLLPLLVFAWLEEWGWDRLVWHDNGALFPGAAVDLGPALLALVVPLLALPQATHYVLDGFIWRVRGENAAAARALGLAVAKEAA